MSDASTLKDLPSVVLECFELQEKLGEGSYASAYLAKQQGMERPAVVKIAHPHLIEGPHESFIRARFKVEIQAAARVTHPNLAVIYTSGEVEGLPALAMEYVQGPTLERWLAQRGRLNEALCARVFGQLADALAALHREGIVHRDISPANIIIERADSTAPQPKLLDFGIARMDNAPTQTAGLLGTPYYMAPEQLFGESSPACDVFSLGSLMWLALTGELLLSGETTSEVLRALHALDGTADPRQRLPRITPQMAELVRAMLQPEPSKRPSAEHVCATLYTLMPGPLNESNEFVRAASIVRPRTRPEGWQRISTQHHLRVLLIDDPQVSTRALIEALPRLNQLTRRPLTHRALDGVALGSQHVLMFPLTAQRALLVGLIRRAHAEIEAQQLNVSLHLYSDQPTPPEFWRSVGVDAVWLLPHQADALGQELLHTMSALTTPPPSAHQEPALIPSVLIERFIGAMPEWLLEIEEAVEDADRSRVLRLSTTISAHALDVNAAQLVELCSTLSIMPTHDYAVRGARLVERLFTEYGEVFQRLVARSRTPLP